MFKGIQGKSRGNKILYTRSRVVVIVPFDQSLAFISLHVNVRDRAPNAPRIVTLWIWDSGHDAGSLSQVCFIEIQMIPSSKAKSSPQTCVNGALSPINSSNLSWTFAQRRSSAPSQSESAKVVLFRNWRHNDSNDQRRHQDSIGDLVLFDIGKEWLKLKPAHYDA